MTKGDLVWYRRPGNVSDEARPPVPGFVLYTTPRRVAIEITYPDGVHRIVLVSPESVEPRTEGEPAS